MALITCPECKKQISEYAVSCPNCGFQLSRNVVSKQKEKLENHGFHDSFYNEELEKHGYHDSFEDRSPQENETIQILPQKPKHIARIMTFVIIVFSLLLIIWYSYNYTDGSKSSLQNSNDIITSSPSNMISQPNLKKGDDLGERENIEKETKIYSSNGNKYVVKEEVIYAATSDASFDLLMNCISSGDKKTAQVMINNGQLIYLYRNDVVFLVKPTFSYYILRREGSTELLYVISELLKKQ